MSLLSGLFGGRRRTYSLDVDYDVSVEELVRRCKFQWVAEEWHTSIFTSANYPSARTGRARLKVHLISCKDLTTQEGLSGLAMTEYRPATLHELLAIGKAH